MVRSAFYNTRARTTVKKLLIFLILAGGAGFAGWRLTIGRPPARACRHVADLCREDGGRSPSSIADECERNLDELKRQGGAEAWDKSVACLQASQSCGEVMGCAAGGVMLGIENGVNQFFKGLNRSVGTK
jgi:hypothetical protein